MCFSEMYNIYNGYIVYSDNSYCITIANYIFLHLLLKLGSRRGRDRKWVGFTTTYAISAYHH